MSTTRNAPRKQTKVPEYASRREFNPGRRTTIASRAARPVVMNQSMFITIRSDLARGRMSLRKHEHKISALIRKMSERHGVRIYKMANVGNHIHVSLRVTRRLVWKGFISGLTGGIARAVGYRRSAVNGRPFWNSRPHSTIVAWGENFRRVQDYIAFNQLEADGVVPPRQQMRDKSLWRRIFRLVRDD